MMLSDAEKAAVVSLWSKVSGNLEGLGAEALERLFMSHPRSRTYFTHFDVHHDSADLRRHGAKVLGAIGEAAKHLDNFEYALSKLSDLHAYNLRVDPGNFKLLSHSIQTVLAAHFPEEFTAETHAAWDKYLAAVSAVLVSKYR
ncbi:hemoglobin subunit alpha-3-like isoform X1 [Pleurodeles waltl]|uniref:hemoglobin subunit alpha-3-like isoform X1 n=1 Tax=Pleurodeles waltl TaxID=8319 RepID=UPI0037096B95